MLVSLQCSRCGGALAATSRLPRCLFCGEAALELAPKADEVVSPRTFLPFQKTEADARAAFVAFARSSFWHPGDLRAARLDLNPILLPAWAFGGAVETHYTALIPEGSSRSGLRPVAGQETLEVPQVLIPSSAALSRQELAAIAPFSDAGEAPFDADAPAAPFEIAKLSEGAATAAGRISLEATHERVIGKRLGAKRTRVSALIHGLRARPLYLPVYVGAYRYKDRLYRIVINGQNGKLTGAAPLSWARVAAVALLVTLLIGCLGLCAAIGVGAGSAR